MRISYSSGMKFTAVIQKDEKMYVAKCAEVGTVSQGKTIEEAIKNLKEATELYLEEFPEKVLKNAKGTILATFEVAEVAKA
jgi:predicted RNase H-like HicB family nuclease